VVETYLIGAMATEEDLDMSMNSLPKMKKSRMVGERQGRANKALMYINDKINYDKILKSYLDTKGLGKAHPVFVYNKELLPAQYFSVKNNNTSKNLGLQFPEEMKHSDTNIDYSRNTDSLSQNKTSSLIRLVDSFKMIPKKSDFIQVSVIPLTFLVC